MSPAQRVGTDDADTIGAHIPQTLAETLKARERPCGDLAIKPAICTKTRPEAYVLTQAIDDDELSVAVASHDEMKTIGT